MILQRSNNIEQHFRTQTTELRYSNMQMKNYKNLAIFLTMKTSFLAYAQYNTQDATINKHHLN